MARRRVFRHRPFIVVDLITLRQPDHLLGIERATVLGNDRGIGKNVIDVIGRHGSRIAEIIHLDRRGAARQHIDPAVRGEALEIDQDVYFQPANELGDVLIALVPDVEKPRKGALQSLPRRRIVIGP